MVCSTAPILEMRPQSRRENYVTSPSLPGSQILSCSCVPCPSKWSQLLPPRPQARNLGLIADAASFSFSPHIKLVITAICSLSSLSQDSFSYSSFLLYYCLVLISALLRSIDKKTRHICVSGRNLCPQTHINEI